MSLVSNQSHKMYCRSSKQAQYLCLNKHCMQKHPFVCSDPADLCKQDHQCCSLVSWNFLVKRISFLQTSKQKLITCPQLLTVHKSLSKSLKEIQELLNGDQRNRELKQLIESPFIGVEKKQRIGRFIDESVKEKEREGEETEERSLRKVEVELDQTKMKIIEFLRVIKDTRRGKDQRESGIPMESQVKTKKIGQIANTKQKKGGLEELYQKGNVASEGKHSNIANSPPSMKQPIRMSRPTMVSAKNNGQTEAIQSIPIKSKIKFNSTNQRQKSDSNQNFSQKISTLIKDDVPRGPFFSKITDDAKTLYTLFYQKFTKVTLLYRASENDFLVSKFHQKCNGKTHTLTIVLTEFDKIIGGYTPLPWHSGGGDWYADQKQQSFLFSLTSGERFALQTKQKAIWCSKTYGPSFGHPDLQIADRAIHNTNSCANFPNCYNNGNYVQNSGSTAQFCGSNTGSFRIKEWEVYELQFPS